jgi:hypothetical protein
MDLHVGRSEVGSGTGLAGVSDCLEPTSGDEGIFAR